MSLAVLCHLYLRQEISLLSFFFLLLLTFSKFRICRTKIGQIIEKSSLEITALEINNKATLKGLMLGGYLKLKTAMRTWYISLFTSFSGHRPVQRECTPTGLRSHERCHFFPIPQPVKVGHTTRVGFFYVPQEQIKEGAVRRDLRFFVLIRED